MARPNNATAVLIATRRRDALDLRVAGVDVVTIGRKLAADPAINPDGTGYPQGYGIERLRDGLGPPDDEALVQLVFQDIRRMLQVRRNEMSESVAELRDLEAARLDRMLFVAYKAALQGDLAAMDRVFRGMDRRARLLGLDMPVKTEIHLSDDELDGEIDRVLAGLAAVPALDPGDGDEVAAGDQ